MIETKKLNDMIKSCKDKQDFQTLISYGVNEIIPMTNNQLLTIIAAKQKKFHEGKYAEIN